MIDRRTMLAGSLGVVAAGTGFSRERPTIWTFDSLTRIGGRRPRIQGKPRLIGSPLGRAILFDGVDDALFLDDHPLAGAERFTFEALFRPDGGAFEQRWFHLASQEAPGVAPGMGTTRMLFEIRVVGAHWYLDAFMRGEGYNQALMVPDKLFLVGRWHHVAQSYDGTHYRSYVHGALQAAVAMPFVPQGPGGASVGIRMNGVNPFRGAIRQAAFTRGEARQPGDFVLRYPYE